MRKKVLFSFLIVLIIISMFGVVSAEKGEGGTTVPVTTIDLTEQGNDYSIKPGRLKFEFNGKLYAIQVRRVKQEYVDFLIMTLDINKQEDITAYTLDDSFSLNANEKKEIDINNDGINDVLIELNNIISTGKYNSVMSADFSIKKINTKLEKSNEEENVKIINSEITGNLIQEPISEPVILNQEPKEQSTFLEKIISWFKGLFG